MEAKLGDLKRTEASKDELGYLETKSMDMFVGIALYNNHLEELAEKEIKQNEEDS